MYSVNVVLVMGNINLRTCLRLFALPLHRHGHRAHFIQTRVHTPRTALRMRLRIKDLVQLVHQPVLFKHFK